MVRAEFEKLTQGNYEDWAPMIEALLVEKDVWDVVEGDEDGEVNPPLGGPSSKPVKAFRRKQQVAKATIILHVDKSQLPHTRFDTPKEIWDELKRVHSSQGFASKLALRRQFFSLRKGSNESIQAWAGKVRHTGYLLERAGFTLEEMDKVLALTQGLPDEYEAFIVSLDAGSIDELTFENILSRLLNEEARQRISSDQQRNPVQDEALAVTAPRSTPRRKSVRFEQRKTRLQGVRCHRCQGIGHMRADCPSKEEDVCVATEAESDSDDVWDCAYSVWEPDLDDPIL